MKNITDVDCRHANNIFKKFKLKNLGEYHDLYVQSDTLFLQMYLKILETYMLKYINYILLIFCLDRD